MLSYGDTLAEVVKQIKKSLALQEASMTQDDETNIMITSGTRPKQQLYTTEMKMVRR